MRSRTNLRTAISLVLMASLFFTIAEAKQTVARKKQVAATKFDRAEQLREALNGKPAKRRTQKEYDRVIDAYRSVYYTAPTSNRADEAALAVAELLADRGRVLNQEKSYKDAIGQYEFLRREYPGSRYRMEALFTIGAIYQDDLNDLKSAKATFEEFIKRYPGHKLVADAKEALNEIAAAQNPFAPKKSKKELAKTEPAKPEKKDDAKSTKSSRAADKTQERATAQKPTVAAEDQEPAEDSGAGSSKTVSASAAPAKARLPRLTNLRFWTTPDYTRVAIDLEDEVKYEAGRVTGPDRIFFDLHDTKLASELIGKQFDVPANGFLRKVRLGQYDGRLARVVLEVDEVAEYSAFLLPNPTRLIIDVHGKKTQQQVVAENKAEAKTDPKPPVKQTVTDTGRDVAKGDPSSTKPAKSAGVTTDIGKADPDLTQPFDPNIEITRSKPTERAENRTTETRPEVRPETRAENKVPRKIVEADEDPTAKQSRTTADAKPAKNSDEVDSDIPTRVEMAKIQTAKNNDPHVTASDKPTTAPVVESVSPRASNIRRTRESKKDKEEPPVATAREARPTSSGDRSLIRALGLKIGRIVIDAGHGGHDTGTIGPNGLTEKDLVLDVALKLGRILEDRLGAEIVYTRTDDTFVPLETRTAVANRAQADLFVSIHANSSRNPAARGVEVYYLNFTSDPEALEVAARENAVSEKSIHELQDMVKKIALKEKIEESRELASDVQRELHSTLHSKERTKNRGVKKAPFVVLIGANMPSVLSEISFLSNPADAKKLMTHEHRKKIAEALYKGISNYVGGLSGVKVASGGPAGATATR